MPRRKAFNKVADENVKIASGRKPIPKTKRVLPRKFQKPKTDNSFRQTLRQHVNVIVGGKQDDEESKLTKQQAQALIPRIQLARQLPSPEAGYNLYSALADKRENEIKGLMKHLETLKGKTAYSQPQPTGRALLDSLNAVAEDQNALNAFLSPTRSPKPEDSASSDRRMTPSTGLIKRIEQLRKFLYDNADYIPTTTKHPTEEAWKKRIESYKESSVREMMGLYEQIRQQTAQLGVEPRTPMGASIRSMDQYMNRILEDFDNINKK